MSAGYRFGHHIRGQRQSDQPVCTFATDTAVQPNSFKKRRCLVPVGFYEWKRLDEKNKQPFAFDLLNSRMIAFAGLWDGWKDPANGVCLQSYTIITTGEK